jgi:hypothetical protein
MPFHLQAPKAQQAAQSVRAYGEELFKQVFLADPRAYARYHAALQAGVEGLAFEIKGSHDLHALHWEALWDPRLPQPFVLHAPMVRRNLAILWQSIGDEALPAVAAALSITPQEAEDL